AYFSLTSKRAWQLGQTTAIAIEEKLEKHLGCWANLSVNLPAAQVKDAAVVVRSLSARYDCIESESGPKLVKTRGNHGFGIPLSERPPDWLPGGSRRRRGALPEVRRDRANSRRQRRACSRCGAHGAHTQF